VRASLIRPKAVAFIVLFVSALSLLAAKPAAATPFHGVVTAAQLEPLDYQRMAAGNVGSLRVVIEWRFVEHTRGNFDWTYTDMLARRAKQFGVRLLPVFVAPGPPGTSSPPTNPVSRRLFARFLGKAAARYGHKGKFWSGRREPYAIRSWQIMNEVNGTPYWDGDPNAGEYAKILKPASRKIRKRDPRAKIMLSGMFFTPRAPEAIDSWDYLRQLYREGAKGFFDTVAIHPYSKTLEGIESGIQRMRQVIRKHRDFRKRGRGKRRRPGVKLYISEFGWGSGQCSTYCAGSPAAQAQLLTDAIRLFERKRKSWRIEGVNWFSWQDAPNLGCRHCPTTGLFTLDGQNKPSWEAFREAAASVRR
jgi:polysaccharide biosynthesis protein PslG